MYLSEKQTIDALAAAVLMTQGKTQIQIAQELKLSQSVVSRLLRDAQPYIHVEWKIRWERLDRSYEGKVQERLARREINKRLASLAEKSGTLAPTVHIVSIDENASDGDRFDAFAKQAAGVLRDLLESVEARVGVAWGSVIWETTQALRTLLQQRPIRQGAPVDFIPLCGDPLIDPKDNYADRTSSRIVSELSRAVNGEKVKPSWLGLVPAFIPRDLDIKEIYEFINRVPPYPRIFGPLMDTRQKKKRSQPQEPTLADDLHMIITAAGPSTRPMGFGRDKLLGLTPVETKLLTDNIYGDVGGVILERRENPSGGPIDEKATKLVQDLTRRWTGLKMSHLEACANRAFKAQSPSHPGTTLLGLGKLHAEIFVEAIRRNLVNHLIIGSDLEAALVDMLPADTISR